MGITRQDGGYSATVEGFFVFAGQRFRLAKTNGATFTLVEPCELPPGTEGELLVIIDGKPDSKRIALPRGALADENIVGYQVVAPF
jgi:hypothetical protein